MAIKIQTLDEAIEDNGLKILVHGPAGVGKTVLSATANAPTLIVSAEAGLLSLRGAPKHIDVTTVKTIDDLEDVYSFMLEEGINKYKWLNLDSISEIAEVLLSEEKAKSNDPRKAYGTLQDEIAKIIRRFRDLPHINVLMTAKQQRFTDEYTGITTMIPSFPGTKLPQQVAYWFDEVFALRVMTDEEGVEYRALQTDRDVTYEAKDRSGMLGKYEKPSLEYIYDKIHGRLPEKEEAVEESAEEAEG